MKFDTIYKRTNAGKIQQWTMEVEGNKYRSISGQTDGVKTTNEWTIVEGKNIGRANETTPEEQAQLEAEAKFTKKLDKHYHCNIDNADVAKFPKAMLAHNYKDKFDGSFENLYSQPKLDGMRCIVTKDGMFSREGKPILSAPHIYESLKHLFGINPDFIFDGELYASHLRDDFEKLISLAKKKKPTPEQIAESADHLEYWVYDLVVAHDPRDNFHARYDTLERLFRMNASVVVTPTEQVRDQEHMDELYAGYLADGQEGQMLRNGASLYQGKRTKDLLKRKEFVDAEYEIVSLNEGKGNYAGMIKGVTVRREDGVEFSSGIKGNQEYLLSLMTKELAPGSEATIRFQNLTSDGIPRFPVVYHIWDGKRDV